MYGVNGTPAPKATSDERSGKNTVPTGGLIPKADPPDNAGPGVRPIGQNARKPYKLNG